jgi:hypothetical protein
VIRLLARAQAEASLGSWGHWQSVIGFAHSCFQYALGKGVPLYLSTKVGVRIHSMALGLLRRYGPSPYADVDSSVMCRTRS